MQRPSGYYGFLDDEIVDYLKSQMPSSEDMDQGEDEEDQGMTMGGM